MVVTAGEATGFEILVELNPAAGLQENKTVGSPGAEVIKATEAPVQIETPPPVIVATISAPVMPVQTKA